MVARDSAHPAGTGRSPLSCALKRDVARELSLDSSAVREPIAAVESPSAVLMDAETQAFCERALAQLPEEQRRVIVMRNWEHRSFVDIGQQLGRTADAARKLWFRGITHLHRLLATSHEDKRL